MSRTAAIVVLLVAAALEACGDAIIRVGLHTSVVWQRYALFAAAGVILFSYGMSVNVPPWDFGKLLGLYVVFFFVIAQLISWLFFNQLPSTTLLIGGGLIIAASGINGAAIALSSKAGSLFATGSSPGGSIG